MTQESLIEKQLIFASLVSFVCCIAATTSLADDQNATIESQKVGPSTQVLEQKPEWTEIFRAIRPDPKPEKLTRNSHYWVSDEKRHDLFRPVISELGGLFVGLGTDQNYLMAGWARPEVLVLFDFDQMVIDLHHAFRVAFLLCPSPREFVQFWREETEYLSVKRLREAYPEQKKQTAVVRAFRKARKNVSARLRRVLRHYKRLDVPTYLDDPEQYSYVVELFKANRVFPVRGDLTATTTLKDVAIAAQKIGLKIRTLYLSNAEQYFKYKSAYRENILALPFDEQSVVIRTAGRRIRWAPDGLYEYVVQSGKNFQQWMKHPKTYSVWTLVGASQFAEETGLSVITRSPPEFSRNSQTGKSAK